MFRNTMQYVLSIFENPFRFFKRLPGLADSFVRAHVRSSTAASPAPSDRQSPPALPVDVEVIILEKLITAGDNF